MPPRPLRLHALFALFLGVCCVACNLENNGDAPPRATIYFPNALALSPHSTDEVARYLYVVNSNFDLRYNAGTVQAYSLDAIDDAIAGCKDAPCVIEADEAFEDEVPIPSFSTGVGGSRDGGRLVVTTRTGRAPSYVRADPDAKGDGVLRCDGDCGLESQYAFTDRYEGRERNWPGQPVAVITGLLSDFDIASDPDSGDSGLDPDADEYALVAHREGELSLFVERDGDSLQMTSVLQRPAFGATSLAYDANTRLVYATMFAPTTQRLLGRFAVNVPDDAEGIPDPTSASVFDAGYAVLEPFDDYRDTRSITFLPQIDNAGALLATPSALVVTQSPSALLLADVALDNEPVASTWALARVKASLSLGSGATRVAAGVVDGVPIAVVASFDSRELALVDLRTMVVRSVVPNLSGPYAVVLDEKRGLAFVTDFRSSVIRVLDVKPALEPGGSEPVEVIATLGKPRVLQELR